MARSTSPGPSASRNQDVVYSYNAPTFEMPDLPDWQLYDGTSVSKDLDKMMAVNESMAQPNPAAMQAPAAAPRAKVWALCQLPHLIATARRLQHHQSAPCPRKKGAQRQTLWMPMLARRLSHRCLPMRRPMIR